MFVQYSQFALEISIIKVITNVIKFMLLVETIIIVFFVVVVKLLTSY